MNLAAAEGHPASVMDMSFANQALGAEYVVSRHAKLGANVLPVPPEIDRRVARLKLATLGIKVDVLSSEQKAYLASWQEGT